jgi:hypothetical protein
VIVPGDGHKIEDEREDEFFQAVSSFIDRH